MIVRESPKKRVTNDPKAWPPKSPHEALLSSPSGRRKYERQRQRNSVSPSPSKRRPMSRGLLDDGEGDEEEEDEETLQLKLAQIEARLKLKKLQKARKAQDASDDGDKDSTRANSRPSTSTAFRKVELARPHSAVQVPVSPTRPTRAPAEPRSPARVLLGIDKGLRAQDVSLKRAASFSTRANTPGGLSVTNSTKQSEAPRGKSFSERLLESRGKEKEKEEKQARIEKSRSAGFGLKSITSLRDDASSRAGSSLSSETSSLQATLNTPKREGMSQSRSIGDLRQASQRPSSKFSDRTALRAPSTASSHDTSSKPISRTAAKYNEIAARDNSEEAASFESYSGLHLKTRNIQHNELTRMLEGKTVVTIPELLKTVKAPEYEPPDMENDYVVFGVICSKSDPRDTQNVRKQQSNAGYQPGNVTGQKFMVMNLTDLKWELKLYLFDTGFAEFWKLPIGTLIAILNPEIMKPKVRDSGGFSLKLASSDDTVIEVGVVRDLDFCHAIKKDGKQCSTWIDARKTEYCDYHIERHVEKMKSGRMEVNTMTGFGKGPGGGKFGMFGCSSGRGGGKGAGLKPEELKREGRYHDKFLHETMYIAPSTGAAARLLDEEDQGFERGGSRAERHKKQLAEKEKERDLAKMLGERGSGAGGDYMRLKGSDDFRLPSRKDTRAEASNNMLKENSNDFGDLLGLAGKRADDVSLAPVKRKRVVSGKSTASSEPVGWGGAGKRGLLLSPKKELRPATRNGRESSPTKKRARLLVPEKGLREPGRESLGTMDVGLLAAMDDDDDDLEVV